MRVRVDLRLPEEMVLELERRAEAESTTKTAIVERALEAELASATNETRGSLKPASLRASKADYTPIPRGQ